MAVEETPAAPRFTHPDGSAIRALVVDDEPSLADLVSMALRYEGWEVRTALTGADADAFWDADAGFVKGFVDLQALMKSNGRLTPRIVESLKKNAYSAMEAYAYAEKAAGVARASGSGIAGKPPAGHPRLDPTMMQSFELKRMEIMTKFSFKIQ